MHTLTRLVLTLMHATPVGAAAAKPDLTKFHHEASLDDFYQVAIARDCLPGSIDAYKNQFHGLFHDVSQVAYYLYPGYTRPVQRPMADFDADNVTGFNVLPLLMQVAPDVPVFFVHTARQARENPGRGAPWSWLVWTDNILLCQEDGAVFCAASAPTSSVTCPSRARRTGTSGRCARARAERFHLLRLRETLRDRARLSSIAVMRCARPSNRQLSSFCDSVIFVTSSL